MATLINMELSAEEAKQEDSVEAEAPKYPWGLCITLNDDTLKKLGIDSLPAIGSSVTITAKADVSSIRAYAEQEGSDRSIDLQITDMSISGLGGGAADVLYGK